MPFQTDNAWPAGLLDIFSLARTMPPSPGSRYQGAYDKLLNYCFQYPLGVYVAPLDSEDERDAIDVLNFALVIRDEDAKPLLIIDVREDGSSSAESATLRSIADTEMRIKYDLTLQDCPLPRLWCLSLFGTRARVFCGVKATNKVDPPIERADPSHGFSQTLADEWDMDILSEAGFAKMKEIVTDILGHPCND